MRFMVFVKGNADTEAGKMPSTEMLEEMGKFNEELVKAGVMLGGDGLHPTARGAKVRFTGSERTVIDGPFTESKEVVAGYWIWQVKSKEEAIEWAKRCPNPGDGQGELELRQIFELSDFENLSPDLKARYEAMP